MTSRKLNTSNQDDVIRGTDEDAVTSKLSAVNMGYIKDEYVKWFVRRPARRSPIINRGTYVRNIGLDTLIIKFLEIDDVKKQIVSLGAGSDTRYFHLKSLSRKFHKYFEIDFPEITAKKVLTIRKHKELSDLIGDDAKLGKDNTEIYASDYCLLSGDLRGFVQEMVPWMESNGFDRSIPTLFLSECVMIYMDSNDSNKIVEWAASNLITSMFIVYEQILPNDVFGSTMLQNLRLRNIELRGIHAYPDLESQKERFLSRGWIHAEAVDINKVHDSYIDPKELARISRLEFLDEFEEWHLLAAHYCIAWAYKVTDESQKLLYNKVQFYDYKNVTH
ncbi:2237_t:CDS:2 [Acaulospora morrowiae]|uniref:Leucine carboxyl methyltransferase 1 n=1 Tax=Acaulospora morrowiae TaxID=94023 RepID=A0A9N8VFR7_9GLOM|nr:2237_t:CDS:2 [Acaulospora morrowiae]